MKNFHVKSRSLAFIKTLLGFEAAARHLSFTKAARELNVTQTAISHQIKSLEQQLEVRLFHRTGKTISLTSAGEKLLPVTSESFDKLESVIYQIKKESRNPVLTVSVTPSFATQWLVPRLGQFWRDYPDVELNVHHSLALANFVSDGIDMAVRGGQDDWPGLKSEFLFSLDLSPVCHPSLLVGEFPLKRPSDLKHHTLLHEDNYQDWTLWLKAASVTDVDPCSGNIMNDSNSLSVAVQNCQGVSLGRLSLIQDDLRSGKIVLPFDLNIKSSFSYYLVYPEENLNNPNVRKFRSFILDEVQSTLPGLTKA